MVVPLSQVTVSICLIKSFKNFIKYGKHPTVNCVRFALPCRLSGH